MRRKELDGRTVVVSKGNGKRVVRNASHLDGLHKVQIEESIAQTMAIRPCGLMGPYVCRGDEEEKMSGGAWGS